MIDNDLLDLAVRITTVRKTTADTENLEQKLDEVRVIVGMP